MDSREVICGMYLGYNDYITLLCLLTSSTLCYSADLVSLNMSIPLNNSSGFYSYIDSLFVNNLRLPLSQPHTVMMFFF